jgi:hypothetical protein
MPATEWAYSRPWLYDKQEAAVLAPERYAVIEASTKSGKTTGCLVWLTERAMAGGPGQSFWWVSPILAQAKIAFRRLKRALPLEVYEANESELTVALGNGAVIWFKGADHPDSLYGKDVYVAVIDEATRCKAEAWHAVRSTLTATRGARRVIGNVRGRRNWAYELARRAEAGEPDMHHAKITARDAVEAGVLDAEEIDDAERQLPAAVFRELYLAEASDDEGNPFGLAAIRKCLAPLSAGAPAAWGWDLAKARDFTVGAALDAEGAVCRIERWNRQQLPPAMAPGADYWEATVGRIRDLTGHAPALVDSTGLGDPVYEAIAKDRPNFEPFKFTAPSKQQLMEGLAVAIQRGEIRFPDGVLRVELESFEYVLTRAGVHYSAPEGMHDDAVCALALARQRQGSAGPPAAEARQPPYQPPRQRQSYAIFGGQGAGRPFRG